MDKNMNAQMNFQLELEKTIKDLKPIGNDILWKHLIEIIKSGKKLRPTFVMLLWENCLPGQSISKELINDLIALELIHTSTLIHDDIIDKGLFRRNISTINAEFGDEIALLIGNIIKDLALKLSTEQGMSALNAASLDVNLGQLWETLARNHKAIGINHYLSIILFKTSKIFTHALDIFSSFSQIILTATEKKFVVVMAMLYQIADDLLDHLNISQKDKSTGQDKNNNVHSFVYASFDGALDNLADKDRVNCTEEIYFIRRHIDIVRKSYGFQSKIEELSAEKQLDFLRDLCGLVRKEAENQEMNNGVRQVLSMYFDKISSSIHHLQLR
jgi:geranylgeranyl pyrophosphate synthase